MNPEGFSTIVELFWRRVFLDGTTNGMLEMSVKWITFDLYVKLVCGY
jgi:hypothetical protein